MLKFIDWLLIESFNYVPEDVRENITENEDKLIAEYEFEINNRKYGMVISINKETGGGSLIFGLFDSEDVENPIGVTKTGSSHLVFSSVANLFKNFVERHKSDINKIEFSSSLKDRSRSKLYDRLVRHPWMRKNFTVDTRAWNDVKFYVLKLKNDDSDNIQR
jgi:hypothetical protein